MDKDYYSILGVTKNSTPEEIKKSYRKLSKKYHPDVSKDGDVNDEKFKEISDAYSVLGDPKKKSEYDTYGKVGNNQGFNPFGGGVNMEDIFGDMFGGGQRRQRGGSDIKIQISLSLDELESGGIKTIRYKRTGNCNTCEGKGGSGVISCNHCDGHGTVITQMRTPIGVIQQQSVCDRCEGSGNIIENKCNSCNGSGDEVILEDLEIDIPRGALHGVTYKYSDKGHSNQYGTGNLIMEFITKPHILYRRQNYDLLYDIDLPFNLLITGGEVEIKGLNNVIHKVNIPMMCNPGYKIQLNGKGLPNMQDINMRGNIIINVKLEFPVSVNEEDVDIISSLSKSGSFIYNQK